MRHQHSIEIDDESDGNRHFLFTTTFFSFFFFFISNFYLMNTQAENSALILGRDLLSESYRWFVINYVNPQQRSSREILNVHDKLSSVNFFFSLSFPYFSVASFLSLSLPFSLFDKVLKTRPYHFREFINSSSLFIFCFALDHFSSSNNIQSNMFNKEKLAYHLSWFIFLILAIQTAQTFAAFTDLPRKFDETQEPKKYFPSVVFSSTKTTRTI